MASRFSATRIATHRIAPRPMSWDFRRSRGLVGSHASLSRRHAPAPVQPGSQVWSLDNDHDDNHTAFPTAQALDGGATKGHKQPYLSTTLDRLENWLGLRSEPGPSMTRHYSPHHHQADQSHAPSGPDHSTWLSSTDMAHSSKRPGLKALSKSTMVDVMVHPVAPSDTIDRIALRYGTDSHTLRRSNRLWYGDPVQMHEQLYIPIESCRHRPADARIQAVERNADGSLHRAPSSSRTDESNPVTITKVDAEALRFFPGDRARPTRGLPVGGDMGASGVDDLIQLQQMRRERGSSMRPPEPELPKSSTRSNMTPKSAASTTAPISTSTTDMTWQPNHRTLGQKRPPLRQVGVKDTKSTLDDDHDALLISLDQPEEPTSHGLNDLLRGPHANSGAAANWMRPIHESLPEEVPRKPSTSKHLWSDLMSGRVSIEDAFQVAVDEWRTASARSRQHHGPTLPM